LRTPLYILALLLMALPVCAQPQFYLRGEVRDQDGKLLPQVSVQQASTGNVTYSEPDGRFGVVARQPADTLLLSLEGFEAARLRADTGRLLQVTLRRAQVKSAFRLASQTRNLLFENQQTWFTGGETYFTTVENGFVSAGKFPATSVSLNVDRASYSNVRRFLNSGTIVPPDAVRIEEMLNYFNFDYQEPAPGQVFSVAPVLTACPWNERNWLLFASIRSRKLSLDRLPPSNLVFLVDVSSSMDMPNRLPLLKAGFKGLVRNLRARDTVSIVVYGGTVDVHLPPTSGARQAEIIKAIDALETGGSTPGASGVQLAYALARRQFIRNGNNRVILATDGDFNVGLRSEQDLEELIVQERKTGVYLTCLGVGMGNYKDSKIQVLAQKGNGNFAYIDTYAEAEKVLVKEFTGTLYTVADDATLQVSFDQAVVGQYRLVGFDNKVGAIRDQYAAIEGGEVGSGFSLLVVFELEPAGAAAAEVLSPAQFRMQYREPGASSFCEELLVPKLSLQPFRELAQPYRFAASVILFGSLLKESPYVPERFWTELPGLARSSAAERDALQREFVQLTEKAQKLYGSRRKKKARRA